MLDVLRPYYFSADVAPEILAEATNHLCTESPRALLDLSLRLHWQLPERSGVPLFVLGAEDDRIANPDDVRATASHHGVEATIVPGLAHMLMLERQWEKPARELARWLRRFSGLATASVVAATASQPSSVDPAARLDELLELGGAESACSRSSPGSSGSRVR